MMPIGISIVIKLTPKLTISSINTISGVGKFCFCGNEGYAGNVGWDCKIYRVFGICGDVGLMTCLSLKKVDKKSLAVTRYRGKHLLDFPPLLRVCPDSKKGLLAVAGSGTSTSESVPCFKKGWLAVAGSGIGGRADGWQPPAEYITSENISFQ